MCDLLRCVLPLCLCPSISVVSVLTSSGTGAGGVGSPTSSPRRGATELKIIDDKARGTVCQNLTEVPVKDPTEVLRLLEEANTRCHITATRLNKQSKYVRRIVCPARLRSRGVHVCACFCSRAHRIFTITTTYTDTSNMAYQKASLIIHDHVAHKSLTFHIGIPDYNGRL